MRALVINCTLKPSPAPSNADALAEVVAAEFCEQGASVNTVRVVDHDVEPGVSSDEGDGDEWPDLRRRIVTGNEDGAHHVISEIVGPLVDIGFTVSGQAWTYWNKGPGPGPSSVSRYDGHEWSARTGRTAREIWSRSRAPSRVLRSQCHRTRAD